MSCKEYPIERFLNVKNAYAPSINSNGSKIAFLMNTTGVPQVWEIDKQGGWPSQLTFYQERISIAEYSPVKDELIFGKDVGGNERQQLFLLKNQGSEVTRITDDPDAIHNFGGWSNDGKKIAFTANRKDKANFHVYIRNMETGNENLVLEEPGYNLVAAWSPDNRYLVILRYHSNMNNDLYLLELENNELTFITAETEEGVYDNIKWNSDSSGFYAVTNSGKNYKRIVYYSLENEEFKDIINLNYDIEGFEMSPDGKQIAYLVNQDGYSKLNILNLQKGEERQIKCLPNCQVGQMDWSADGSFLALSLTGPVNNPNIWIYDMKENDTRQLTHASKAGIPKEFLVEPDLVSYESFDGLKIPAFYYKPKNYNSSEKLPVIIDIHGGPESQRRVNFNPITQYLVNRGFAVLHPNVRGSSGYGKEYLNKDNVEKRMDSVKDIRNAVNWLVEEGNADEDKIAVMGGSYGGFMVLSSITEYPDLWAAAVDIVGIANFITFLENTGPWRRKTREAEYGSLAEDREFLKSISPIHKVDNIQAPLMVIHGANDPRVPIGEAEQIVEKINEKDGIVEYLRFEDEGHGLINSPIGSKPISE